MSEPRHVKWSTFAKVFQDYWKQGEHVFINGKTGSGKTELLLTLMHMRKYGVVFVTKPRDPIFRSPLARGYARMEKFDPKPHQHKILLRGKSGDSTQAQVGHQFETFTEALDTTYAQGGWTLGIDETLWISNRLRLMNKVGDTAFMGRALGITGVFATQRPRYIPKIVPQSCTYAFLGMMGDMDDIKVVSEMGRDKKEVEAAIRSLRNRHDFVFVDTEDRLPLVIVNTQE